MTFILNILHRDMSILAADRKAMAEWPVAPSPDMTAQNCGASVVHDYKKITLNSSRSLALAIAGNTQDHFYLQQIERSASIDEWFLTIRKHMDGFMRVHDRSNLHTLTSFMVNQGVATFFDRDADNYFTNTILFSPVESQTRLHRSTDGIKIFHAGSGSTYFEKSVGLTNIDSFVASSKNSCALETCISWMQDAFKSVSACDPSSGGEAVFVVSTRSAPDFRSLER